MGCRWVYIVKVGPIGEIDRLKARLVVKGYTHVYGLNNFDTFSHEIKINMFVFSLLWLPFVIGLFTSLTLKNAFLHGDLEEEIYMEQPSGFVARGSLVWLVNYIGHFMA